MEGLELDPIKLTPPLDWEAIFGNRDPVEIEIGFGKGYFLIRSALENPGKNYLGVERSQKCYRITKERILKRGLKNIRIVKTDAEYLVSGLIPDASVSAYHIYFPDPWPKRRHAKKRLFKESFVVHLERTLVPGGRLYVATDVLSYYGTILELITTKPRWRSLMPRTGDWQPSPCPLPPFGLEGLGNYEIKYRKEGREIYYGCFEKSTNEETNKSRSVVQL